MAALDWSWDLVLRIPALSAAEHYWTGSGLSDDIKKFLPPDSMCYLDDLC